MPVKTRDFSHLGTGELLFRRRGAGGPMLPMGNAEEVSFSIEADEIEQPEHRHPGGGNRNRIERITDVTLTANVYDLSPRNIAAVIYGDDSEVDATKNGDKASEKVTVYKDGYNPLKRPDAREVTLYKADGGEKGEEIDDDHFEIERGCVLLTEAGEEHDGEEVIAEYHHGKVQVVEALMHSGHTYEGTFRGVNEADDSIFAVDIHRFRFTPTGELGLVSDEFAQLEMEANVLSDPDRGAGESAYFRFQIGEPRD